MAIPCLDMVGHITTGVWLSYYTIAADIETNTICRMSTERQMGCLEDCPDDLHMLDWLKDLIFVLEAIHWSNRLLCRFSTWSHARLPYGFRKPVH